tara:strand:- start:3221 stop:4123 length:903 start_codon:yes stop_codon:yes gene_type:complete
MAVKIGINPLTWTNDDMPSLGRETPLEVCLKEGCEAGYRGFELGNKFPRKANILSPILDKYNLELVSGWHSGFLLDRSVEEEAKSAKEHIELLKAMGCKVLIFCELTNCVHGKIKTPVRHRVPFQKNRWTEYGKKLSEFSSFLKKQGLQLVYHHHMGTIIQNEEEIDKLMRNTSEDVGLLFDTGHAYFAGANLSRILMSWQHRIHHIHCKDIRKDVLNYAKNSNLSFLDAVLKGVFTVPGDGCIDYEKVFNQLKEANYKGWLVIEAEQDPAIATPLKYAQIGIKNIIKIAQNTGLIINHN